MIRRVASTVASCAVLGIFLYMVAYTLVEVIGL